jgi:phage terminase small subunit
MQPANLTTKQAKWIEHYLSCGNASASAVKAGYSPNGASVAGARMLRNVSVQKALQARQAADATRLSIRREDVLAGLQEAIAQAREQQNPMAMIRGWAEVAKMLGLYAVETKRVELTTAQESVKGNYAAMSDEQLLTLIAQGAAAD